MSQSQTGIELSLARPLTTLSEDEEMFRSSMREFAEGELRRRVSEMEEQGHLDPALIKQCFELGLMGIETPEEYGGAGGSFFQVNIPVAEKLVALVLEGLALTGGERVLDLYSGVGLFSALIAGWVNGDKGSRPVARPVRY